MLSYVDVWCSKIVSGKSSLVSFFLLYFGSTYFGEVFLSPLVAMHLRV